SRQRKLEESGVRLARRASDRAQRLARRSSEALAIFERKGRRAPKATAGRDLGHGCASFGKRGVRAIEADVAHMGDGSDPAECVERLVEGSPAYPAMSRQSRDGECFAEVAGDEAVRALEEVGLERTVRRRSRLTGRRTKRAPVASADKLQVTAVACARGCRVAERIENYRTVVFEKFEQHIRSAGTAR